MSQQQQQQCPVQWVRAVRGGIPDAAVGCAGNEADGRPLFVARSEFKGGVHPGKAAPHLRDGGFEVAWGGKTYPRAEYEVLCGDANRVRWVPVKGAARFSDGSVRPVEAGRESNGQPLYVGRVPLGRSLQLGKAGPHLSSGMSYAAGGGERNATDYEVLVYV